MCSRYGVQLKCVARLVLAISYIYLVVTGRDPKCLPLPVLADWQLIRCWKPPLQTASNPPAPAFLEPSN